MGLFASRPEEPTEWAGLPSEPLEPRSPADRLPTDESVDALGLVTGAGVASIVLDIPPVEPPAEPSEPQPEPSEPDEAGA
ncbi:MAG TPA: hypothetical protein VNT50_07280 [Microbacterium sp.]|uniref:hypothetical protein n=1 Tax=Microbacterium sp. TaxID=51671 RepID=UPI002C0511DE|nr:hypothetical protein [Microbacterium sp.]HWI31276.1 hypothetical protein [Microbacterium sp.]